MRGRLSAWTLLGGLLFSVNARAGAEALDALLRSGQRLEAEGKTDEALEVYATAIAQEPLVALPYLRRGLILVGRKNCDEALPDLSSFIRLSSGPARTGPDWDEAVLRFAQCRREVRGTIELTSDQETSCRLDNGPARDVSPSSPASWEIEPGDHRVDCTADGQFFRQKLTVASRERKAVAARLQPNALRKPEAEEAPTVAESAPPAKIDPPPVLEPPRPVEFALGGGFGPSRGAAGLSLGLRVGNVGFTVGTGFFPIGAEVSFFLLPGQTTPYVSVGYLRLANGLFGGSTETGHEGFGVIGIDVRVLSHLSVRLGAGAAYLSTTNNPGPLTFEAAVFWLP